jgi:hypothetical protein
MLNQLKTIDNNLRTRLNTAQALRRTERSSETSEPRPAEDHARTSGSPLPAESVYFIIELA